MYLVTLCHRSQSAQLFDHEPLVSAQMPLFGPAGTANVKANVKANVTLSFPANRPVFQTNLFTLNLLAKQETYSRSSPVQYYNSDKGTCLKHI